MKDGGPVNKPPVSDHTNYDYWKVMMVSFHKYLGNKAWKALLKGWNQAVGTSEDGTTSLKLEVDWTNVEEDEAFGNSKVMNAIFNGMDKNMFILINTRSEAKDAWEILKTPHEGT